MKIVVIDGQGGRIGAALVERFRRAFPTDELIAVGTNSAATAAMLKAGAELGATGENPAVVCCADADVIAGPVGIVSANSLLGEVTPKMAEAVSCSRAQKVLIPVSKCRISVMGVQELPLTEYIRLAVCKAEDYRKNQNIEG